MWRSRKNIVRNKDLHSAPVSIYDITVKDIRGKDILLSEYRNKNILVVNTASECGYTPQYSDLQKLHLKNNDLVILGFPSDEFGNQEPGTEKEIEQFCTVNFKITFPLFSKVNTKGENISQLYSWLTDPLQNGWNSKKPEWNFCKYLVDKKGRLIAYYSSAVPLNVIEKDIIPVPGKDT